jgi:hypothetical protein
LTETRADGAAFAVANAPANPAGAFEPAAERQSKGLDCLTALAATALTIKELNQIALTAIHSVNRVGFLFRQPSTRKEFTRSLGD